MYAGDINVFIQCFDFKVCTLKLCFMAGLIPRADKLKPNICSSGALNHEAAASRHGAAAVQLAGHHLCAERRERADGKLPRCRGFKR